MKFWKSKKTNKTEGRVPENGSGQRVYTYYTASRRQIDKFERSNQQRQQNNTKKNFYSFFGSKAITIAAIFSFVIVMVGLLTLSSNPAVYVDKIAYRQPDLYKQKIAEIIKRDPRNYFKPSLQIQTIEQEVLNSFAEAKSVQVESPLLGRAPIVKITTAEPFAVLIQPNADSLVIDSSGQAVMSINETTIDTADLSTLENNSGIAYIVGEQVFKPYEMESLLALDYQLKQDGNSARLAYIIPEVPRELRLNRAGYYVKFSLDDSSGADTVQQFGALKSIEKSIKEQGIVPPTEYIDVRLGDKVYIK